VSAVIDELVREARRSGIRPWIALKERLAGCVLEVMARSDDGAVLQGGAALHFVYRSPRLSADVDFVGVKLEAVLTARSAEMTIAAQRELGVPARWSLTRSGRMVRGKLTLEIDASRRLALPIEGYEVPAHRAQRDARYGVVEQPEEIAADKIVATADRYRRRGTIKLTDLYDLWFLHSRLGVAHVGAELLATKARDYGVDLARDDVGAAIAATQPEELQAALEGVLPTTDLAALDTVAIVAAAASLAPHATP
jgi:hypothetical protein